MGAKYEETMTIPFAAADVWRRAIEVINHQPGVAGVHTQPGLLSECAFPLQIFDWGKNKENVSRIRLGLEPPSGARAS